MLLKGTFKNKYTNEIIKLGNLKLKESPTTSKKHIIGLEDNTKNGYYARPINTDKIIIEEVSEPKPGMLVTTTVAIIGEDGWEPLFDDEG